MRDVASHLVCQQHIVSCAEHGVGTATPHVPHAARRHSKGAVGVVSLSKMGEVPQEERIGIHLKQGGKGDTHRSELVDALATQARDGGEGLPRKQVTMAQLPLGAHAA